MGDGRIGMLGYVGVPPPSPRQRREHHLGFLGGVGVSYITNEVGPDEGLKPAAFLGIVVQVGQANPALSGSAKGERVGPLLSRRSLDDGAFSELIDVFSILRCAAAPPRAKSASR